MREKIYLLERKSIEKLLNFALISYNTNYPGLLSGCNLGYLLELLSILVCCCQISTESETNTLPPTFINLDQNQNKLGGNQKFLLSQTESDLLLGKAFFPKIIREGNQIESISQMCIHLCWENKKVSKFMINIIKDGMSKVGPSLFKPYFKVLKQLLNIKDTCRVWRIDAALVTYLQIIESNSHKKRI